MRQRKHVLKAEVQGMLNRYGSASKRTYKLGIGNGCISKAFFVFPVCMQTLQHAKASGAMPHGFPARTGPTSCPRKYARTSDCSF